MLPPTNKCCEAMSGHLPSKGLHLALQQAVHLTNVFYRPIVYFWSASMCDYQLILINLVLACRSLHSQNFSAEFLVRNFK